jgi:O-antigen/teichoic acid export membrane protein
MERFTDAALITIPLNLSFMPAVLVNAAMTTVYFPRMIEMQARNDTSGSRSLFTLFYGLVSAFTVLVTVSLILYPHVLLYFLYGGRYQVSAPLVVLIAPVVYLYTMLTVLTFTIVAQGRIRASMIGAFTPTIILLVVITFTTHVAGELSWFAVAHTIAALLGLLWQFWTLGYDLWQPLAQTGKQLLVAFALLGMGRLLVPDSVDSMFEAIAVLGLATVVYVAWVWQKSGAGYKAF